MPEAHAPDAATIFEPHPIAARNAAGMMRKWRDWSSAWSRVAGIFYWAFSQLTSFGVGPWALFVAIAFATAYSLRGPGIFLGHLLVAIVVVDLDVQCIQSEMRKPGRDPNVGPDQDFVFTIGVFRASCWRLSSG